MNIKQLDTFGKRLIFLLDLKEIKKKDLADYLNIAPSKLIGYLNYSRKQYLNIIYIISYYLKFNYDFILIISDNYQTYVSKEVDGKLFEIEFNDEKLHLSKKDIEELFEKLKSVGFDVKKLL